MKPEFDYEPQEHYRDEYKEASSNLRHYSTLRFTIFTVFIARSGRTNKFWLECKLG